MSTQADPLFDYPPDHERTNLPRVRGMYRSHCRCGLTSGEMPNVDAAVADLNTMHARIESRSLAGTRSSSRGGL